MNNDEPRIENQLSGETIEFLENRLYTYNFDATKLDFHGYLSFALRNHNDEVIGGIHGYIWGRLCKVETMWVSPDERSRKLGSRLLQLLEREALGRGCNQVVLETFSFQAPPFYIKNGYSPIAEVPDYPAVGHTSIVMRKNLSSDLA